jgi:signal transduction histidine kinase
MTGRQKKLSRLIKIGFVGKFVLFTALIIILTSVSLSFFLLHRYRAWNYRRMANWGRILAYNLSADSELAVLASNRNELKKLARNVLRDEDVTYCRIEDTRGKILAEASTKLIGDVSILKKNISPPDSDPLAAIHHSGAGEYFLIKAPVLTRKIEAGYEDLAFSTEDEDASTEPGTEEVIGSVCLGISTDRLIQEIGETRKLIFFFTLITILLGVTATTIITRYFTRPIFKLLEGTRRVARGDFSRKIPVTSLDEIGTVTQSFNSMIGSLEKYRDRVEEYSQTLEDKVKLRTADLRRSLDELQSSQESLIRSEKFAAVGELLTGITHEINNKLAPILGYAELLQLHNMEDESMDMLKVIESSALSAKSIIESLLTFARPKKLKKSYQDINQLLRQTIDLLSYKLNASGVELIIDLDPDLPPTMVDGNQISQVFLNIINNAQQATETSERKKLRIISWREGDNENFKFTDTGPGVTDEVRKRIFDPFFSTKRPGKGSGLGMSVSYQIITNHGGEIRVGNEEDWGASFTIRLPIEFGEVETQSPAPEISSHPGIVTGTILAVDDEKDTVSFISSALSNEFQVEIATDGKTALEKLRNNTYDCILLDLRMAPPDGKSIYNWLRENRKREEKKVIFMTGDTFEPNTREFIRRTGNLLLLKPFPIRELRAKISEQLRRTT